MKGSRGGFKQRLWRKAAHCLAPPFLLRLLSQVTQDQLCRDDTAHSRLSPTLIISKYSSSQTSLLADRMETMLPLPKWLYWVSSWQKPTTAAGDDTAVKSIYYSYRGPRFHVQRPFQVLCISSSIEIWCRFMSSSGSVRHTMHLNSIRHTCTHKNNKQIIFLKKVISRRLADPLTMECSGRKPQDPSICHTALVQI